MNKLTENQERFAQLVALGTCVTAAYRQAYNKSNATPARGWELMQKEKIEARVTEIRKETSENAPMKKIELVRHLADVILTPIADLDDTSPLIQSYEQSDQGRKVKMVDKLGAAKLLSSLCGWDEPDEVQVTVGGALARIMAIRRGES